MLPILTPAMMIGAAGYPITSITAGQDISYDRSGYDSVLLSFGSKTGEPFPGQTMSALMCYATSGDGAGQVWMQGNVATTMAVITAVRIAGVLYSLGAWSNSGANCNATFSTNIPAFSNGATYSVQFVGA